MQPITVLTAAALFFFSSLSGAEIPQTASNKGAVAYIVSPEDGAEVSSPVTVRFGLKGMGVAPAGVEKQGTGHHHLLVDQTTLPALDKPLGGDVKHFGGGQTEVVLELAPGQHTLQLILGDHYHVPHKPAVISEPVTIRVK